MIPGMPPQWTYFTERDRVGVQNKLTRHGTRIDKGPIAKEDLEFTVSIPFETIGIDLIQID
jgi:hypothetical protein